MIQTQLPFPADGESNWIGGCSQAHGRCGHQGLKQKEEKAHSVQLEVLYLELVKQKMSFLAPLNTSRLQFSAVHSLKNTQLTPSLKILPQSDPHLNQLHHLEVNTLLGE